MEQLLTKTEIDRVMRSVLRLVDYYGVDTARSENLNLELTYDPRIVGEIISGIANLLSSLEDLI